MVVGGKVVEVVGRRRLVAVVCGGEVDELGGKAVEVSGKVVKVKRNIV